MKAIWRDLSIAAVIGCGGASSAFAQVTIQQPVVGGFSASTTVSVPDRGSTLIGGVGSAASGRTTSGVFRPGTSSGMDRSASSLRTSVSIHDLQAMDEALLREGTARGATDPWTPRLAERRAALPESTKQVPREDTLAKAARYERLARDAEGNHKPIVARLHWQRAAKLGSTMAKQRLVELAAR